MSSKQSNLKSSNQANSKDPMDLHYVRRASVRHQKRQIIFVRLSDFPERYIFVQCAILSVVATIIFSAQIAIIVQKTKLYFIVSGFWMALVYILCIISLIVLVNKKSHGSLMATIVLHVTSIIATIGGIIVNVFDMAMFNIKCITACEFYSPQYLNLIIIIFSSITLISTLVLLGAIEYYVLRDSRRLNMYLNNRN